MCKINSLFKTTEFEEAAMEEDDDDDPDQAEESDDDEEDGNNGTGYGEAGSCIFVFEKTFYIHSSYHFWSQNVT